MTRSRSELLPRPGPLTRARSRSGSLGRAAVACVAGDFGFAAALGRFLTCGVADAAGDAAARRLGDPDHGRRRGLGAAGAAGADMRRAAQADRLRDIRELGGLGTAAPDQAVGGRPGRERCGHRHGRDDLADPLTGRRAPGARMPPGVGLGGAADLVVGGRARHRAGWPA